MTSGAYDPCRRRIGHERRRAKRRGVLLLVVLSVLVLFVLAALAFTVVASHYRRTSTNHKTHERTGDPPSRLLDRAMYQLLRDTVNDRSSIRRHSLLADLYGNDGYRGKNSTVIPSSGQHWTVAMGREAQPIGAMPIHVERSPFYFSGCVLSVVSGSMAGQSARIVPQAEHLTSWEIGSRDFSN